MNSYDRQLHTTMHVFNQKNTDNNHLLSHKMKEGMQLNYCRFLATRAFNFFREHYDFPTHLVVNLQKILNDQFDKIPYGWGITQIDAGITRIIENFIIDRNIHRHGTDHISI